MEREMPFFVSSNEKRNKKIRPTSHYEKKARNKKQRNKKIFLS